MTTTSSKRVLITFGRSFLTLAMARLLHAHGHTVYTADSLRFPITRYSNAVEAALLVARPTQEPDAWAHDLARITRERQIDVVLTVHEETQILAYALRRHPDLFPESCEVPLAEFELVDQLENKFVFQRTLEALGVPTLDYALVTRRADLERLPFGAPFALKQCYSRGAQQVFKVRPGELPEVAFEPGNPWIAQEWAEGPRFCSYSVCRNGQVLAHSLYPVGYAIDGRSCLYYQQVEHDGISKWVRDRVKALNFSGQVGFDFIDTGRGVFAIECNPRATSGLLLFDPADGIDRALLGGGLSDDPVISPAPGVRRMLGPGMLLYGWRASSQPSDAPPGNTLRGFVRAFRAADEVITSRSDPRPALALPLAMADIFRQGLRYRVGLAEAFMHDHEWRGSPPVA